MSAHDAPIIACIAAPEDEAPLTPVIARLRARGFVVAPFETLAPHTADSAPPLLTLVAVAPASNRSPSVKEQTQRARAAGALAAPLILSSRRDLPSDLARLQWVDLSGAFESGWLDLLAALDRVGVTRYPPAPGWFDWELALARAYRGLLPPGWRAYRANATYYAQRARNTFIVSLGLVPALLCALGVLLSGILLPLWNAVPGQVFPGSLATVAIAVILTLAVALMLAPQIQAAYASAKLRDDRSEVVIFSPDGVGLRTRDGDTVRQFHDLVALEQVADPPRQPLNRDVEPERGVSGALGEVAGALRLRYGNGAEETIALGDRYPGRALIAQQVAATFIASRQPRGRNPDEDSANATAPIFISHARKDHLVVDRLDEFVRLAGYQTWVDRSMLAGGEDWSRELRRAIAASAALVVVVSPASLASPVVREEYEEALLLGKPVLAVLLRPTRNIPEMLRMRLCADVTAGPGAASWRRGWAPLLLALEHAGARPVDPAAFSAPLVIARALLGKTQPGWEVFKPPPLARDAAVYGVAAVAVAPLIGLGVSLALGANGWILAAWVALALLLGWQCLGALRMRYRQPWRLVVTPAGAAMLRADHTDSYAWADYDGARVATPKDTSGAMAGAILLRLRATGRERRIASLSIFKPGSRAMRAIIDSFHAYHNGEVAPSNAQAPTV